MNASTSSTSVMRGNVALGYNPIAAKNLSDALNKNYEYVFKVYKSTYEAAFRELNVLEGWHGKEASDYVDKTLWKSYETNVKDAFGRHTGLIGFLNQSLYNYQRTLSGITKPQGVKWNYTLPTSYNGGSLMKSDVSACGEKLSEKIIKLKNEKVSHLKTMLASTVKTMEKESVFLGGTVQSGLINRIKKDNEHYINQLSSFLDSLSRIVWQRSVNLKTVEKKATATINALPAKSVGTNSAAKVGVVISAGVGSDNVVAKRDGYNKESAVLLAKAFNDRLIELKKMASDYIDALKQILQNSWKAPAAQQYEKKDLQQAIDVFYTELSNLSSAVGTFLTGAVKNFSNQFKETTQVSKPVKITPKKHLIYTKVKEADGTVFINTKTAETISAKKKTCLKNIAIKGSEIVNSAKNNPVFVGGDVQKNFLDYLAKGVNNVIDYFAAIFDNAQAKVETETAEYKAITKKIMGKEVTYQVKNNASSNASSTQQANTEPVKFYNPGSTEAVLNSAKELLQSKK